MTKIDQTTSANASTRRHALKTIGSAIGVSLMGPLEGCGTSEVTDRAKATLKDPIYFSSVTAIAEAIKSKNISSEEITKICLDRIHEVNPKINAVVQIADEKALSAARKADQALIQGKEIGPLHGVPMTIKDSFDTAGIISTGGTTGRSNYIPTVDATVVTRLKNAGAVLMGKTNTPEFTLAGETTNLVYGQTNNPYKLSASPGGSSGGAAAIISSGGSPFDIGTDTGGSIRNPAHCCGLCGIRPTSGRVPRTGHIISYNWYNQALTTAGPLARYVEDLFRILPVIAGADGIDPFIYDLSLGDPEKVDISTLKLGFYTDVGSISPVDEVYQVFKKVLTDIEIKVASTEEIRAVGIEQTLELFFELVNVDKGYGVNSIWEQAGTTETSPLLAWEKEPKEYYETPQISPKEMFQVFEKWAAFNSSISQSFRKFDIILCPASSLPAPVQGFEELASHTLSYTATYNMTGWPVAVVRAGASSQGLPIGIQIVGKPWQEHKVLAVAKYIEDVFGGFRPPNL